MPDQKYNEKELLQMISLGDHSAFTHLFNRYWSQVYMHVLSYIKSPQYTEDVTQDIFFGIWMNRQKLAEIEKFEHYLRVVTRHRTISELRKKLIQVEKNTASSFSELLYSLTTDLPNEQLDLKQAKETIHQAIELLPERRKQVFRMSRMEDLTHAEIAVRLNISKATVNEHISEALLFLRTHLASHSDIFWAILFLVYPVMKNN